MNTMNMAGMNAVGAAMGSMPMMNNGVVPRGNQNSAHDNGKQKLNTHIYDYFIKNELYDCARAMIQSDCPISTVSSTKTSPGRRRDGEVNGIDENGMDADSKDDILSKRPEDLPAADTPNDIPEGSFLYDWWCLFWDVFSAQRTKKPKPGEALSGGQGGLAMQYVQHTQQASRMRQEQQQQLLRQMNPQLSQQMNAQYLMRGMPPNGMMGQGELRQKALQNSRHPTPQMMQQMQKSQQMMHQQMQRDGSDNDANGQQRPNSPSSAENAPSPSKRPRINGAPLMMPNGRGLSQGMPTQMSGTAQAVQANNLLAANGIHPEQLTASQFNSFQQQNPTVQQRSIQVYAQNLLQHQRSALNNQTVPKGMTNAAGVPNQDSPMMPGVDVQNMGPAALNDYYAGQPPQMRGMQGANGQGGNHALHDYQMQLMLLEQQNKKRLLMARQEQDMAQRPDGPPGPNGQTALPPGMSPQGSRSGQSPGPNDQMKRGTPKINPSGLPGSPLPDGSMPNNRGSPAPMSFQPGQLPPEMTPQLYQQMKTMGDMAMAGVPNGNVMRPPSSHPQPLGGQLNLELLARQQQQHAQAQQAGRMQNGHWQQGPQGQVAMMQQPPQSQQPQPMGTPQTRNQQMPPPQAPPTGANTNGRTQPSSPQLAAPPTPQQSNKANPKAKKDGKPKRPTKKGSTTTAATPSAEGDPPPIPTPSTPITPQHPNSFNSQKAQPVPGQAGNAPAPTSAPAPAPLAQPPQDQNHVGAYGSMDGADGAGFDLTFSSLDNGDVLESFDFDSYLANDEISGGPFNFDPTGFGNPDAVEAGTGDV